MAPTDIINIAKIKDRQTYIIRTAVNIGNNIMPSLLKARKENSVFDNSSEQYPPADDEPKVPIACPICGSIDCIGDTCPYCKSHIYKD